jgi:hypothetical protein
VVKSYADANHPPVAWTPVKDLTVRPGKRVPLFGTAHDPDGDAVSLRWWQYSEADSYGGTVQIDGANQRLASFEVPRDAKPGDTIHLIMEVKDSGEPALTRYQRVIVTVAKPKRWHRR